MLSIAHVGRWFCLLFAGTVAAGQYDTDWVTVTVTVEVDMVWTAEVGQYDLVYVSVAVTVDTVPTVEGGLIAGCGGRVVEDSVLVVGNGRIATSVAKMSDWAPEGL